MLWESYGTHASCYTYHVFLELERYLVVNRRSVDQSMSIKSLFSAWQGDGEGLYLTLVIWCIRMMMKVRKEGKR